MTEKVPVVAIQVFIASIIFQNFQTGWIEGVEKFAMSYVQNALPDCLSDFETHVVM